MSTNQHHKTRDYHKWKKVGMIWTIISLVVFVIGLAVLLFFVIALGIFNKTDTLKVILYFLIYGGEAIVLGLIGICIAAPFWGIGAKHTQINHKGAKK